MFPTIFEFQWDAGHMIFFGVFYAVIAVVVTSLLFIAAKSVTDVYRTLNSDNNGSNGELPSAVAEEPSVAAKVEDK
jgi:hypothetical protein